MTYLDFTPEELETEEWREVQEHPRLFVSTLGRLKSLRVQPSRLLTGVLSKGYHRVHLREQGVSTYITIHILVARAFIPNPLNKSQVNHKDGNKRNNRVGNLEWNTPLENRRHAAQNGLTATGHRNGKYTHPEKVQYGDDHWTHRQPQLLKWGEAHHNAKLTAEQVNLIRHTYQPHKYSARRLAREFGVSQKTILNILKNKTYTTKGYPLK